VADKGGGEEEGFFFPGLAAEEGRRHVSSAMSALVFVFGIGAGILLAFTGYAVLEETASLVLTVFLACIFLVTLVGVLAWMLRRPILRYLFGIANVQLELFAKPLSEVAEGAFIRDVNRVTAATRALVHLALARYAWMVTRRWIVASLTGLVAALAALAGTALLFKQNDLIAQQSALLEEQNVKIASQTELLVQDVQLAEAARNAEIAVKITGIAELLGDAMTRAEERAQSAAIATGQPVRGGIGSFDVRINPWLDLGRPLVMQITSSSRAARPYRFLENRYRAHDSADKIRVAMERRREELPQAWAAMQAGWRWTDPPATDRLIDRPASPERGQLIQVLVQAGLRDFELLNLFGLDLSFAWSEAAELSAVSMQGAQLSYATFDQASVLEADFTGAALENARFRGAHLRDVGMGGVPFRAARPPYQSDSDAIFAAAFGGADFTGALLERVDFAAGQGPGAVFDGALLEAVEFTGTQLSAATFRGAALVSAAFDGASLRSVDFDGAFVFRADFLTHLAQVAEPGSFRADRFRLAEVPLEEVFAVDPVHTRHDAASLAAAAGSDRAWRVERVADFETVPQEAGRLARADEAGAVDAATAGSGGANGAGSSASAVRGAGEGGSSGIGAGASDGVASE